MEFSLLCYAKKQICFCIDDSYCRVGGWSGVEWRARNTPAGLGTRVGGRVGRLGDREMLCMCDHVR